MDAEEIWKPIPGYEPYEASSLGRIRGFKGIRKPVVYPTTNRPYVQLVIQGEIYSCSIAKLVAATFLGPCPEGYFLKHLNGLAKDARVSNLEYRANHGCRFTWKDTMREKRQRGARG